MGIIVKLLGSGLGMASEAIQYVKPQLTTIARQRACLTCVNLDNTINHIFLCQNQSSLLPRSDPRLPITNTNNNQRLSCTLSFQVRTRPANRSRNCFVI